MLGEEARTFRMDALLGGPAVAIVLMVFTVYQWVTIPLELHGTVALKDGSTVDIAIGCEPDILLWLYSGS